MQQSRRSISGNDRTPRERLTVKLLISTIKEALILIRDRSGLAIIFLMPIALAMIVVLVQDNAFDVVRGAPVEVLFVDRDGQSFGRGMMQGLTESKQFRIVQEADGRRLTEETARQHVQQGDWQVCIIIPEGTSQAAKKRAAEVVAGMLNPIRRKKNIARDTGKDDADNANIIIYLDPAISGVYRNSIINSFYRLAQGLEMQMILETHRDMTIGKNFPADTAAPESPWRPGDLVGLKEVVAGRPFSEIMPTAAQQNIPAWTLFAMFLTVLPLSGSLVKERQDGTFARLRTLPVSYWTILSSKVLVYVAVCLCQFGFMMLLGWGILPLLGIPRLEVHSGYLPILVVAVSSALAASGFGILTGAFARTNSQASVFGATFVVIAAALGGIMVPPFLMPPPLQPISKLSPLRWGLDAFITLFLRRGNLSTIWPDILRLWTFFVATMLLAVLRLRRRE